MVPQGYVPVTERIVQHISNMRDACRELEELLPADIGRIAEDRGTFRMAERLLENVLESMFDCLAVLAVGLGSPATGRRQAVEQLRDRKLLTGKQAEALWELLAFRNVLVHAYRRTGPADVLEMIGRVKREVEGVLSVADKVISQRRTDG